MKQSIILLFVVLFSTTIFARDIVYHNKTNLNIGFGLDQSLQVDCKPVKMWIDNDTGYDLVKFDHNTHIVTFRYDDEKDGRIIVEVENYNLSNSAYLLTNAGNFYILNEIKVPQMR